MLNLFEVIVVGFALAVDAMLFSFSYGLVLRKRRYSSSLKLACSVGFFQAAMPLLGYTGGLRVKDCVAAWDHWLVLLVFCVLGITQIRNAWSSSEDDGPGAEPLSVPALLIVGVATSIDALAVGVCMAIGSLCGSHLNWSQVMLAVSLIGLITFACSLGGFNGAKLLQRFPRRGLETGAGLLLIGLGLQNFVRDLL